MKTLIKNIMIVVLFIGSLSGCSQESTKSIITMNFKDQELGAVKTEFVNSSVSPNFWVDYKPLKQFKGKGYFATKFLEIGDGEFTNLANLYVAAIVNCDKKYISLFNVYKFEKVNGQYNEFDNEEFNPSTDFLDFDRLPSMKMRAVLSEMCEVYNRI